MSDDEKKNITKEDKSIYYAKIASAVFYGLSSFLITVVNKRVLTSYEFPSFLVLSLGQIIATVVVLYSGKKLRIVTFPKYSNNIIKEIFPLPLIYLANMIFGLGGTKALSLPMFAALRRFSILMTMLLEFYILKTRPTTAVQLSVYGMVGGALLAASYDLSFNLKGYTFIMITNASTALNGVFVKKKLSGSDLGTYGLMFYNCLMMLVPAFILTWILGDLEKALNYNEWSNPLFVIQFILSCIMGFILNYSIVLCTQHNSALTTTIIGCLKNVSITYIGMFIGGDYVFSWFNCIGINISVLASLAYTYVTFGKKKPQQAQDEEENEELLQSGKIEKV
ncbi:CLUMA_CG009431, isoform A [Clunio marinus]|uniref:CLUMA_CG009431, isoform A n=1 Tax=Clunio marinus TaxID=568069 RepID=A0A1J1IAK4_9DIPT|nr:CLUMA_CG009431, isoform A [Clunio marinus]